MFRVPVATTLLFLFGCNAEPTSIDEPVELCGNGLVDEGEECDDGANAGGYGACAATCLLDAHCGDGFIDAGFEDCDLGVARNDGSYEGCTPECAHAGSCGDGVVDAEEECDDAGVSALCFADCTLSECGDGVVHDLAMEECDDGNLVAGDGCSPVCEEEEPPESPEPPPAEVNWCWSDADLEPLACPVPEQGDRVYVSASVGSDLNDGADLSTPVATIGRALAVAVPGDTVVVAAGTYPETLSVGYDVVVKGGFNADFSEWNPEVHSAILTGAMTVSHDDAVWGGFVMRADITIDDLVGAQIEWHRITAGAMVRNQIELVFPDAYAQGLIYATGIVAGAREGATVHLSCNDVYASVPADSPTHLDGVYIGGVDHAGAAVLDSNRICTSGGEWVNQAVAGNGACVDHDVSVELSNNLIGVRDAQGSSYGVRFPGCGGTGDLDVALTNNTIWTWDHNSTGVAGYGSSITEAGTVWWTLVNNLIVGERGRNAVHVGSSRIARSEGNLLTGYSSNQFEPAPDYSYRDDVSGVDSASSLFVDPYGGNFRPAAAGAAIDNGVNAFGTAFGQTAHDQAQDDRSPSGDWTRGALLLE